ncbi:hypothetical protein RhiLY_12128 [Ceratobasidium sp. AG-Ba]|nr:hypothetical protein RhiLY_12128 [Ceratobasidium sp. AG-Ba]
MDALGTHKNNPSFAPNAIIRRHISTRSLEHAVLSHPANLALPLPLAAPCKKSSSVPFLAPTPLIRLLNVGLLLLAASFEKRAEAGVELSPLTEEVDDVGDPSRDLAGDRSRGEGEREGKRGPRVGEEEDERRPDRWSIIGISSTSCTRCGTAL